jgi:hypothetical protein
MFKYFETKGGLKLVFAESDRKTNTFLNRVSETESFEIQTLTAIPLNPFNYIPIVLNFNQSNS